MLDSKYVTILESQLNPSLILADYFLKEMKRIMAIDVQLPACLTLPRESTDDIGMQAPVHVSTLY